MNETIAFDVAHDKVMHTVRLIGVENVDLTVALGRVLAKDILSDIDMPPFKKSAMDGYACRRMDLPGPLTSKGEIPAGVFPTCGVGPGECMKIMTGAPVPDGADCVIMVEETNIGSDGRILFTGQQTADNLCQKGEDIRQGDLVLKKGGLITPAAIAVLATVGCTRVPAYKRMRVAVIATGSELVEPGQKPAKAQIRASNSYQLCAQISAIGAIPIYMGIVPDREEEMSRLVQQAMAESDFLIISGGVSEGDFDLTPHILQHCGFRLLFDSVAMQPGRPVVFGEADKLCVCGTPGNPVSTYIVFELLLKPYLWACMGYAYQPQVHPAILENSYHRRNATRQASVPVAWTKPGYVRPIELHGSAHINAMTEAQGLMVVPLGVSGVERGETVYVRSI